MNRISPTTASILKSRKVVLATGATVVVLLIWLVAFFLPQGSHLSTYKSQLVQLQAKQSDLEAQLAQLRTTSRATPKLLAMQATLSGLIPTTPDFYDYITLMSNTTAAAGVHLVSITPSTSGTPITGTDLEAIPVILSTSGTYDSTLGLIKAIYALPRLTTINSMAITGGGPGTNRSTLLDETFSLTIYSSARPTNPNAG